MSFRSRDSLQITELPGMANQQSSFGPVRALSWLLVGFGGDDLVRPNLPHVFLRSHGTLRRGKDSKGCDMTSKASFAITGNGSSSEQVELRGLVVAAELADRIAQVRLEGIAFNSRRGYDGDWRRFASWCSSRNLLSLPAAPETAIEWLIAISDLRDETGEWLYAHATVKRAVAAIAKIHEFAGEESPTKNAVFRELLRGYARIKGRPARQMRPLMLAQLKAVLDCIDRRSHPAGVIGCRDTLILLLGFAGAFRREELAALTLGDIEFNSQGVHVRVTRSKTDQEAHGHTKGMPRTDDPRYCTPCAIRRWISILELIDSSPDEVRSFLKSGRDEEHCCEPTLTSRTLDPRRPLFPSMIKGGRIGRLKTGGDTIHVVLRSRLARAGIDPERYGAHSLRSGFVTEAFRARATHHEVMRQTGHRNPETLEIYSREQDPLRHNAVTMLPW